mmetsp:Transcript_22304/g.49045  ORF Transcript_22304/g.49045 Transcript_22304/m.49045 type:complete len:200 (-) Transcript_22304:20-619(-)
MPPLYGRRRRRTSTHAWSRASSATRPCATPPLEKASARMCACACEGTTLFVRTVQAACSNHTCQPPRHVPHVEVNMLHDACYELRQAFRPRVSLSGRENCNITTAVCWQHAHTWRWVPRIAQQNTTSLLKCGLKAPPALISSTSAQYNKIDVFDSNYPSIRIEKSLDFVRREYAVMSGYINTIHMYKASLKNRRKVETQ